MDSLIDQLLVLVVGALVLFVPGGAVITWLQLPRLLPGYLVPAAAFCVTAALVAMITTVMLAIHAPILWVAIMLGVVTAFAMWAGAPELRKPPERARYLDNDEELLAPAREAWHRRVHPLAAALAVAVGLLGLLVGGAINRGDSLFHAAFANKLLALDHPTFHNTQLFFDGDAHPGYVVPVAQELLALIAMLSGTDVPTVLWTMAAITVPLAALTYAGLGYVLFRSHAGAIAAMCAFVLVHVLMRTPFFGPVAGSMIPGTLTAHILIPTAIAAWLLTLWPSDTRAQRRTATLGVLAIVATVTTHISYILFLGIALGGYLLVWSLRSPWPQAVVRRHAIVAAGAFVATAVLVASYLPSLLKLGDFAESSDEDTALNALSWFRGVFIGDVDGFHLRVDYLVALGAPAALGLAALLLAFLFRRDPAGWYLLGSTAIALTLALSDTLFPLLVAAASPPQASRLALAIPTVFGLALACLCVAWLAGRLWERGSRGRAAVVAGGAVVALLFALSIHAWPALARRASAPEVPDWFVYAIWIALLFGLVAVLVEAIRRWRRHLHEGRSDKRGLAPPRRPLQPWHAPLSRPLLDVSRTGVIVAVLVAVIGSIPAWYTLPRVLRHEVTTRPASALRVDALRAIDPEVQRAVRKLPERSVVMAPHTIALELQAIAPVYTVAVTQAQVANTEANRKRDRRGQAKGFYSRGATPQVRDRLLRSERVDAVLTPNVATSPLVTYMDQQRKRFRLAATGEHQRLYVRRR